MYLIKYSLKMYVKENPPMNALLSCSCASAAALNVENNVLFPPFKIPATALGGCGCS